MTDFKFGDLICCKMMDGHIRDHDAPLMYVGACGHNPDWTSYLIDILSLGGYSVTISCKMPLMWQRCTHIAAGDVQVR